MFWGAPLVTRELEAGTFRLAWNQSVTRTRWMAVKLGLIGLAAMATAGLLSLMVTWWASPSTAPPATRSASASSAGSQPALFGARGIAPIGYAAFAFVLGVTAGVLIRRTLPAMAVTLAVFAAVQLIVAQLGPAAPHRPGPRHHGDHRRPQRREDDQQRQDHLPVTDRAGRLDHLQPDHHPAGQRVHPAAIVPACQSGTQQQCDAWLASQHLRQQITYQPASRYWAFQWYETAIFLALALALAGFCAGWIRHRRLA